ncbi:unnamed protein product [Echinostoma caproni]|uniref:I/LWEQ domain-containing protein n=1 Tax=Echinostoma caproni TaxID=27848 RepID=A0A183AHA7_9TREM|nr:unnamed protein product [Echinostoma caproni]
MLKVALDKSQGHIAVLEKRHSTTEQHLNEALGKLASSAEQMAKLASVGAGQSAENERLKQQLRATQARSADLSATLNSLRAMKPVEVPSENVSKLLFLCTDIFQKELQTKIESIEKDRQSLREQCVQLSERLNSALAAAKLLQSSSEKKNAYAIREQALSAEMCALFVFGENKVNNMNSATVHAAAAAAAAAVAITVTVSLHQVSRLSAELVQLRQAADARIRALRARLQATAEETFLRNTREAKVKQLNTAAIVYANEVYGGPPIGANRTNVGMEWSYECLYQVIILKYHKQESVLCQSHPFGTCWAREEHRIEVKSVCYGEWGSEVRVSQIRRNII